LGEKPSCFCTKKLPFLYLGKWLTGVSEENAVEGVVGDLLTSNLIKRITYPARITLSKGTRGKKQSNAEPIADKEWKQATRRRKTK